MRQYGRPVNQAAPKSADKPKEKDDIEESSKLDSEKKENNTRTKFQKLLVKLKLDKHHRMERFAISSISLILVCALLTAYAAKLYLDHKKIVLTEQAIYTTDTVWSLSGGNVHVENIYRNEATTKVFILCKMGEDTMDKMSTDASNYQMFVTGYTERLTNNLAGVELPRFKKGKKPKKKATAAMISLFVIQTSCQQMLMKVFLQDTMTRALSITTRSRSMLIWPVQVQLSQVFLMLKLPT